MIPEKPREILVRGPNWLGDLVMSTPGFRALRQGFPDSRITLLVRAPLAPLLAGAPWFDEIRPLHSYHRGPLAMAGEAAALRRVGYDLGVCIPESWSSTLLMSLAGVGYRVGYGGRNGVRGRSLFLSQSVPVPAAWGKRRLVARERFVLDLVSAIGCATEDERLALHTTEAEESTAEALLRSHGIAPGTPLVAIAPGASYGSSKLWPAESFAKVGDEAARSGARVLVLGTSEEALLAERVVQGMHAGGISLAGAVDLGGLKAVLRRCRVLICNDAGARHVAVALGVPGVVMMGPTSLEKTNLNLDLVRVLETDVACRPCYHRVCPIDHRCMTRLSPETASRAMLDVLARAHPEAPEA